MHSNLLHVVLRVSSTLLDKDKEEVTEYFNNNGFERWNKIYSESDEVNNVQMDIRTGHAQTIDKVNAPVCGSTTSCFSSRTSLGYSVHTAKLSCEEERPQQVFTHIQAYRM